MKKSLGLFPSKNAKTAVEQLEKFLKTQPAEELIFEEFTKIPTKSANKTLKKISEQFIPRTSEEYNKKFTPSKPESSSQLLLSAPFFSKLPLDIIHYIFKDWGALSIKPLFSVCKGFYSLFQQYYQYLSESSQSTPKNIFGPNSSKKSSAPRKASAKELKSPFYSAFPNDPDSTTNNGYPNIYIPQCSGIFLDRLIYIDSKNLKNVILLDVNTEKLIATLEHETDVSLITTEPPGDKILTIDKNDQYYI